MIQFEAPLLFLVWVVGLPYLIYWTLKSYANLPAKKRWISLGLRFLGLLMLILALSRPVLLLKNTKESVLFLVDVSESVSTEALEKCWKAMREQTGDLGLRQSAGLVLFAREPRLVIPPTREPFGESPQSEQRLFHKRERERRKNRRAELERSELTEAAENELTKLESELAEIDH